jgi:hypothetical protein
MIKKVQDINVVPEDLQELLLPENGEFVPIGTNMYELYPFPIEGYLKLLGFLGKYFTSYNKTFTNKDGMTSVDFFGNLANSILNDNILTEFAKLFPDIEAEINEITFEQLQYLLGIIYKLNFMIKKKTRNPQNNRAIQEMMEMLGLSFLNQETS